MSLSDQDLQKHVGKSLADSRQQLESQGYKVHLVRIGKCATGYVPSKVLHHGEDAPAPEKRAIITYNGDDPEQKVTAIRQD